MEVMLDGSLVVGYLYLCGTTYKAPKYRSITTVATYYDELELPMLFSFSLLLDITT